MNNKGLGKLCENLMLLFSLMISDVHGNLDLENTNQQIYHTGLEIRGWQEPGAPLNSSGHSKGAQRFIGFYT